MAQSQETYLFNNAQIAVMRVPFVPTDPFAFTLFFSERDIVTAIQRRGLTLDGRTPEESGLMHLAIWRIRPIVSLDMPLLLRGEVHNNLKNAKSEANTKFRNGVIKYWNVYPYDAPDSGIVVVKNLGQNTQRSLRFFDMKKALSYTAKEISSFFPSISAVETDPIADCLIQSFGLVHYIGRIPVHIKEKV